MASPSKLHLLPLGLVLAAFAGNSLLCRIALSAEPGGAVAFTAVRIISGAVVLASLVSFRGGLNGTRVDYLGVAFLYGYAILFAVAYVELKAGIGALILFSGVQATMIGAALLRGERPPTLAWVGLACATGGLLWLLAPGLEAPPAVAGARMAAAGAAWGLYSLRGSRANDPLASTALNFIGAVPLALAGLYVHPAAMDLDGTAFKCAIASGALTSGVGYAVWYSVVRRLSAVAAAASQLAVPALTALGGVLFLAEPLTPRLLLSSVLIVGGLGMVVFARLAPHPEKAWRRPS